MERQELAARYVTHITPLHNPALTLPTGPIEKGANDGQMSYANSLVAALRAAVASKILSAPKTPGGRNGGKSKKRSKTAALEDAPALPAPTAAQAPKQPNWGMLDPIRPLVPFADTIDMLFTPKVVITVLGALLVYAWFFRAAAGPTNPGAAVHWSTQQRHIAYDEIWRREESELWKWLEQRVAIDRVQHEVNSGHKFVPDHEKEREGARVDGRDIKQREVDEAIRVTEERLRVLKGRVMKEREKSGSRAESLVKET
jgi:hypothetical protein